MSTKTRVKRRRPSPAEVAAMAAFYGGIETANLPFPRPTRKSPAEGKKITIQTTITFD